MVVVSVLSIAYNMSLFFFVFFFQAEDGIRDLVRSRGLGDVYKRQVCVCGFDQPGHHTVFCRADGLYAAVFSAGTTVLPLSLIHI